MALVDKRFRGTPKLRTDPRDESARHATWFELFHDLAFVAIIARIGLRLGEHPEWSDLRVFALILGAVWWLWVGETYYSTRFDTDDDYVHRALQSVQLMALVVLAATVDQAFGDESRIFATMYAIIRSLLVFQYLRAGYHVREALPLVRRLSIGFSIGAAFWWASLFVPLGWRLWFWLFGLLADIATPLFSRSLHTRFPPHVTHLPERFGLFTILVLGELIIGTVAGLSEAGWELNSVLAAMCGTLIAVGVWWTYFDRLDDNAVRALGSEGTTWLYQIWLYMHFPLVLSLIILGLAIDHAVLDPVSAEGAPTLLVGGIAAYLVFETIICFTAIGSGRAHAAFTIGIATRLTLAALLVAAWWFFHLHALGMALLIVIAMLIIIIQEHLTPQPPKTESDEGPAMEED